MGEPRLSSYVHALAHPDRIVVFRDECGWEAWRGEELLAERPTHAEAFAAALTFTEAPS